MDKLEITIGELFQILDMDNDKYDQVQISNLDLFIETPKKELTKINGFVKKEKKQLVKTTLDDGRTIETADKHIFSCRGEEVFADEAVEIDTVEGIRKVVDTEFLGKEDVYDITIDSPHWYITANNIIHHNTLVMSHLAAGYIAQGYDVLYISLEEEEKKLAQRILANVMDVPIADLPNLSQAQYMRNVSNIKNKVNGRLIYKQYPATSIHAGHLRNFLEELKLKEDFTPKIVFVDYIALMQSMRVRNDNSYAIVKAVSEEIRGLAMEKEFACWTGAQLNRGGASSSDPDMTDTAESFGLPMGADFYVVAVTSDELKKMGQYKLKQLKNRYAGTGVHTTFGLGVDIQKQRLYDLDSSDSFNQSSKPSNLIPSKGQTFIQDKEFEGFGIKT